MSFVFCIVFFSLFVEFIMIIIKFFFLLKAANDIREDHNRLFKGEKEIRATQLTLDCRLDSDSDGEDFEI